MMSLMKSALLVVIVTTCVATSCLHKPSQLDKVTLRLNWSPTGEHAYIYLGIDKGFFKEQNIDLDVMPGQGSTIVAQLVGNGSNDFGLCSGDTVLISRTKAVPLKALAVFYHQYPGSVCSLKEKNILSPKDFAGKKIGVLIKSTTFQIYQGMLKNAGVDRSKITEVPIQGTGQEILSGFVDAGMQYTNYTPVQVRYAGKEVNEIFMSDYGMKVYGLALITNDDLWMQKKDLVQRFVNAMLKSLEYSKDHPDEAVNSFISHNAGQDRGLQQMTLTRTNQMFFDDKTKSLGFGYMTQEDWRQTQDALLAVGLIDQKIDLSEVYDDSFWKKYNGR